MSASSIDRDSETPSVAKNSKKSIKSAALKEETPLSSIADSKPSTSSAATKSSSGTKASSSSSATKSKSTPESKVKSKKAEREYSPEIVERRPSQSPQKEGKKKKKPRDSDKPEEPPVRDESPPSKLSTTKASTSKGSEEKPVKKTSKLAEAMAKPSKKKVSVSEDELDAPIVPPGKVGKVDGSRVVSPKPSTSESVKKEVKDRSDAPAPEKKRRGRPPLKKYVFCPSRLTRIFQSIDRLIE